MASIFGGIDIFKLVWEKTLLDKNQYSQNGVSKNPVFITDELM